MSHDLVFIKKEHQGENVYTYFFEKPDSFAYSAGQHAIFTLPHERQDKGGKRRLFSISSAPSEKHLALTMRFLGKEGSSYKRALHGLKKGDSKMSVRGPSPINDFFQIEKDQQYIFLIGGIGITPLRSVLIETASKKQAVKGVVLWANKKSPAPLASDISGAITKLEEVTSINVFSPERIGSNLIESAARLVDDPIYIISGTPGFSAAMEKILLDELDVPSAKVKSYSYTSGLGMGRGY